MANLFSTSYRVAIEKSISNEATRRFKTELALFDPYYWVAKRLLIIAQGDEPVDENSNDASDDDKVEDEKAKDEKNDDEKNEDEVEDKVT